MSAAPSPGPKEGGQASPDPQRLAALLQLEAAARQAEATDVLRFTMANDTRRLIEYRQGLVFGDAGKLLTASSLAVIEPNAPFVQFVEGVAAECAPEPGEIRAIGPDDVSETWQKDWTEFAPGHVLLGSVRAPGGDVRGTLWLGRDRPFHKADGVLLKRLCETYGHAWAALEPTAGPRFWQRLDRRRWLAIAAAVLAFFLFPVRLSTLAPVEVEARDPFVVAAPIDGVVAEILVPPNTRVEAGAPLFRFEDTALRNQLAIAERSLQVAGAELRTATQGAFASFEQGSQVALLRAQLELQEAERDYARELLDRVTVLAERPGLVLYTDESDWIGKPVAVGERIMQIADPSSVSLRIDLPVDDAIVLDTESEARIFLDAEPLVSHAARITSASYRAMPTPDQTLAYQVGGEFADEAHGVRIGLQGTAKLYGQRVPLAFYLFRRPFAKARQWIGL